MAVIAMQKVAIITHASLREELLQFLHEEGVLQIQKAEHPGAVDHTEAKYHASEVQFAITTLKEYASKETLAVAAKKVDAQEIVATANSADIRSVIDTLHTLEEKDTAAQHTIQEAQSLIAQLQDWNALPHRLDGNNETETSVRLYGTISEANAVALEESLALSLPRTELQHVQNESTDASIVAIVWKEDLDRFEQVATELGWTQVLLPSCAAKPSDAHEEAVAQMREAQKVRDESDALRTKLAVELPNLTKVATYLAWLHEKQEARESLGETGSTVTLLGWMPQSKVTQLDAKLRQISTAVAVLKVKPDEGEEAPVALKNPKILTPFESVTGLYGYPLYHEFDPTKALSPFFILYFALCLTDAGYGLVLALIFGITIWQKKLTMEEAKLPWLLFMSGVVTFFVSIPFGGYFGLTPDAVPGIFTKTTTEGELLFRGQIWNLNAQSGIDFLQNLSLFLGITHLFFGMFLAGWHKVIHGKKMQAFWVDFTSHILLGAAIVAVVVPGQASLYTLYGAIALLIWGKGYGAKWFVRPILGLIGLLNFVIGMISNSLSYLRLLALGLVTGAIAAAINQVAIEIGNLFPTFLAIPIIIVIFLLGHTVSIALNTLGSFIHSGRLQFIEFFSQFFEGGGKVFEPFKRSTT